MFNLDRLPYKAITPQEQIVYTIIKERLVTNTHSPIFDLDYILTLTPEIRKITGSYYTSRPVVEEMLSNVPIRLDYSYADLECGVGHIILVIYDLLMKEARKQGWTREQAHKHICEKCLWFNDIDPFVIWQTKLNLCLKQPDLPTPQFNESSVDILMQPGFAKKFNIIVINPPYVDIRTLPVEYKNKLAEYFPEVFNARVDLFNFFCTDHLKRLSPDGFLVMISSRYWLGTPAAQGLRNLLKTQYNLIKIHDYEDERLFLPFAEVCTAYIVVQNSKCDKSHQITFETKTTTKNIFQNQLPMDIWLFSEEKEETFFKALCIANPHYTLLQKKKEKKSQGVCVCRHGMVYGCNKVLIVDQKTIDQYNIEPQCLEAQIDTKALEIHRVSRGVPEWGIYLNDKDPKDFPNATKYLEQHKVLLEKRSGHHLFYNTKTTKDKVWSNVNLVMLHYPVNNIIAHNDKGLSGRHGTTVAFGQFQKPFTALVLWAVLNSSVVAFCFRVLIKKRKGVYMATSNRLELIPIPKLTQKTIASIEQIAKQDLQKDVYSEDLDKLISQVYKVKHDFVRKYRD